MFEKEGFSSWFKENTPKEGLSENTTFSRQFLRDAWDNGYNNGYNKANEWHYVKDGKPKDNEYVLIYTDIKNVYIARLVEDNYFITNKGGFVQTSAVIAWKEIVLPKLSNGGE